MVWASGAARRIGLSSAREGAAHAYTDCLAVPDAANMHAIDRYWLVAEALGVTDKIVRFTVPLASAALQWGLQQLGSLPRPWLMLGVGAALADQALAYPPFRGAGQPGSTTFRRHRHLRWRSG